MFRILRISVVLIGVMIVISSCRKDKVPIPFEPEPTKYELINGDYKVYDTMGVYLHDLRIVYVPSADPNMDSLRFENFDGEFTFTTRQTYPEPSNIPGKIDIGFHDTLLDSQSKRWKLTAGTFLDYNRFYNDTIKLRFQKTNINYWIEDAVPFEECYCKQIAVKQ